VALIAEPPQNVHEPITAQETQSAMRTGVWTNDAALKLVTQDAEKAENFESMKQWVMHWNTATILYQSPAETRYWEGTGVQRANVPLFLLATAVNSLVPQIIKGMFFDDPPFQISPRPKTSADAARACGDLIKYELQEIDFREQLRLGCINAALFGTGVWKFGWETYIKEDFIVKRKTEPMRVKDVLGSNVDIYDEEEELEEEVIERQIERPTFENITNLRHLLVDPGLRQPNIQKGKYVIHRMYTTINDLEKIRNRPGVNLPSTHDLIQLMFPPKEIAPEAPQEENPMMSPLLDARAAPRYEATSADPLQEPLELLERWDNDRYILVLDRKLVLASTKNPFQKIPFLSVGWWDVPEAFWSMGLAKTVGAEQRLQQGINNAWLDTLALMLNGVYVRIRGESVPTQDIRVSPGHVIDVDTKDGLKPLTRPDAVPEVGQALEMSNSRLEQTSGASEFAMQGVAGSSGHSNLARSATGANLLAGGSGSRVDDFVEKLAANVVVPFLYEVHLLNRRLMPLKVVREILTDELNHEFIQKENDPLELLNAHIDFEISAGAKLQARRNMAQSIPIIIQFLESAPITQSLALEGKKVSVEEIIKMIFEVSHWKNFNSVIVPMTQQEMQQWQQNQPGAVAAAQMMGKAKMQQQQAANKAQLANDENIARAGREVLRQAYEKATGPMMVTGQPGGPGFGGNA
jgi:hypothetical protein